ATAALQTRLAWNGTPRRWAASFPGGSPAGRVFGVRPLQRRFVSLRRGRETKAVMNHCTPQGPPALSSAFFLPFATGGVGGCSSSQGGGPRQGAVGHLPVLPGPTQAEPTGRPAPAALPALPQHLPRGRTQGPPPPPLPRLAFLPPAAPFLLPLPASGRV